MGDHGPADAVTAAFCQTEELGKLADGDEDGQAEHKPSITGRDREGVKHQLAYASTKNSRL